MLNVPASISLDQTSIISQVASSPKFHHLIIKLKASLLKKKNKKQKNPTTSVLSFLAVLYPVSTDVWEHVCEGGDTLYVFYGSISLKKNGVRSHDVKLLFSYVRSGHMSAISRGSVWSIYTHLLVFRIASHFIRVGLEFYVFASWPGADREPSTLACSSQLQPSNKMLLILDA